MGTSYREQAGFSQADTEAAYKRLQKANAAKYDRDAIAEEERTSIQKTLSGYSRNNPMKSSPRVVTSPVYNIETGDRYGESSYDIEGATDAEFKQLGDIRGEEQSWLAQLGAGFTKGLVLTGTTFLNGTLGLLYGGFEAIKEGEFNKLWNNDFTRTMDNVNKAAEKALPNYYTDAELNDPWYTNLGTANFWGDKFIKNLGFTAGAALSGGVWAGAAKIPAISKVIEGTAKVFRAGKAAAPAVSAVVGSVISATGEGSIEALHNSDEWVKTMNREMSQTYTKALDRIGQTYEVDSYGNVILTGNILPEAQQMHATYLRSKAEIEDKKASMGNLILGYNIPILTVGNLIQFGKAWSGGFRTASLTTTKKVGRKKAGDYILEYYSKGATSKAAKAWNIMKNPLAEGNEEFSQRVAAEASGLYYGADIRNFYKAQMDPSAEKETITLLNSIGKSYVKNFGQGAAWEEFFIGALTGALGIPGINIKTDSKGQPILNEQGKPKRGITMQGGIFGAIKENNQREESQKELVEYLNKRLKDPKFVNYYRGLIRNKNYQNMMDRAIEENNHLDFADAEFAQMVSDIVMFDNAGRIKDLKALINKALDPSMENLTSVVENTTEVDPETDEVLGPFAKFAKYDSVTGTVQATFTEQEEIAEIQKIFNDRKKKLVGTIDQYLKNKDNLTLKFGNIFNKDQLSELTWMQTQIQNWENRQLEMAAEIQDALNLDVNNLFMQDENSRVDSSIHTTSVGRFVAELLQLTSEQMLKYLQSKPAQTNALIKGLKDFHNLDFINVEDAEDIITKLEDIMKLNAAKTIYNRQLLEYLVNPGKLAEDQAKDDEQAAAEDIANKDKTFEDELNGADSLDSFRQILGRETDPTKRNRVVDKLAKTNDIAKTHKELESFYAQAIQKVRDLAAEDISEEDKSNAMKILAAQYQNSQNLSSFVDPKNFDETDLTGGAKLKARIAAMKAIDAVKKSEEFRERFADPVKKPDGASEGTQKKDEEPPKGKSEVPAVPLATPSGGKSAKEIDEEPPIGGISASDMTAENSGQSFEHKDDKSTTSNKKYWIPAIPEVDIEASRQGDLTDFVDVKQKQGLDFRAIWDYLKANNAFDYVNAAKLKSGSKVGFMIDPQYNENTIFIIDMDTKNVIGSLYEADNKLKEYEGLEALVNKIHKEYQENKNKATNTTLQQEGTQSAERFIASPTTTVSKIMIGKIPYDSTERSLKDVAGLDIDNTGEEGKVPIQFAIVKNGTLFTNGKVDVSKIKPLKDISNKEGRLYMLIPNGAGGYSLAAVRTKHFNKEEFDINNTEDAATARAKEIQKVFEEMAEVSSDEELKEVVGKLNKLIYTKQLTYKDQRVKTRINFISSEKTGKDALVIELCHLDANGQEIYDEEGEGENIKKIRRSFKFSITLRTNKFSTKPEEISTSSIVSNLIDIFQDINPFLQIEASLLNKGNYNNAIVKQNLLTTNVTQAVVKGNWFTLNYIDDKGNVQTAINPTGGSKVSPVGGKESLGNTDTYDSSRLNGKVTIDYVSQKIYDESGKEITSVKDGYTLIKDLIWSNSLGINDPIVETPEGRYLDRIKEEYVSKQKYEESKKSVTKNSDNGSTQNSPQDKSGTPKVDISFENSQKVIEQIREDQDKVDKTKTDENYYYVLEEDGEYHAYDRIHKRLGDNSKEAVLSENTKNDLNHIARELEQLAKYPAKFKEKLVEISKKYKRFDPTRYGHKRDKDTRKQIMQDLEKDILNSNTKSENQKLALRNGTMIDEILRAYFNKEDDIPKPEDMTQDAYDLLLKELDRVHEYMKANNLEFFTNNIVLYHKFENGTRIAGEVDILARNKKTGEFTIIDLKTSKYTFRTFVHPKTGKNTNFYTETAPFQKVSTETYYAWQVSGYRDLFESRYSYPVADMYILPMVVQNVNKNESKDDEQLNKLRYVRIDADNKTGELFIPVTYTPNANIPTASIISEADRKQHSPSNPVQKSDKPTPSPTTFSQTNTSIPVMFDPKNEETFEGQYDDFTESGRVFGTYKSEVGFFELRGTKTYKVRKGELYLLGTFNGSKVYFAGKKVFNKDLQENKVDSGEIKVFLIFENGTALYTDKGKLWSRQIPHPNTPKEKFTNESGEEVYSASFDDYIEEVKELLSEDPAIIEKGMKQAPKFLKQQKTAPVEKNDKQDGKQEQEGNKDQNGKSSAPITGALNKAAQAIAVIDSLNDVQDDYLDDDDLRLRETTDKDLSNTANIQEEVEWLGKVLPQLTTTERLHIVKGLIEVSNKGTKAWGMFHKGVITLSEMAAKGTLYHEAFHAVFHTMLGTKERATLLREAARIWGNKSVIELEEQIAENFREYMLGARERTWGQKILDFFKKLLSFINNSKQMHPYMTSIFHRINKGYYRNANIQDSNITRNSDEVYTSKMQVIKDKAIANGTFMKDPNGNPTNLNERQWLTSNNGEFSTTNDDTRYREIPLQKQKTTWDSLDQEQRDYLKQRGFNKETLNRLSQEEIDNLLRCQGI